jgi:thiamine pyrophosphokinase
MYGIIGLGGKCFNTDLICGLIPDKYFAVAADSGIIHFELLGIKPDLLVGDMDSIPPDVLAKYENIGLQIMKYNPVKNMTDSEIAVEKAIEAGCDSLIFLGAFGDRLDHMFANQMMAASLAEKGIPIILTDGMSFFYTVTANNSPFKYPLSSIAFESDVVSVVLAKGDFANISIEGLEYELLHEKIQFGTTRAVSNIRRITQNNVTESSIGEMASITIESGVAFFIHTKNNN